MGQTTSHETHNHYHLTRDETDHLRAAKEDRYAALEQTRGSMPMTYWAAKHGDVESMLRALTEEGQGDPATTYAAAANGHKFCMQAAATLGAPWDPRTTYIAAA